MPAGKKKKKKSAELVLRCYQKDLIDRVRPELNEGNRTIAQLPTGGGKTAIAKEIVWREHEERAGLSSVWVTHRAELASQSSAVLCSHGVKVVNWYGKAPGERGDWQPDAIHFVSDRWRNLPPPPNNIGLMVCDEAHHVVEGSQWARWLDAWEGGKILGLTATPTRLSKKEGLRPPWDSLVLGATAAELTEGNWMAEAVFETAPSSSLIKRERLRKVGGDYAAGEAEEEVVRLLEIGTAIKHSLKMLGKKSATKTLWYAPSVLAATTLTNALNKRDEPSAVIHGSIGKEERAAALSGFADGTYRHLVSVEVLLEGLDVPRCDSVVVLRPTASLVVHLQMLGRALRPIEGGVKGGKVLVIDLAGNTIALGSPTDDRPWSLDKPLPPPDGEAKLIPCCWDDCFGLTPPGAHTCPSCERALGRLCGHLGGAGEQQELLLPGSEDVDALRIQGCGRWQRWGEFKASTDARKLDGSLFCRECLNKLDEEIERSKRDEMDAERLRLAAEADEHEKRINEWRIETAVSLLDEANDNHHFIQPDEWCDVRVGLAEYPRKYKLNRGYFNPFAGWRAAKTGNPTLLVGAFVRATFDAKREVLWIYPTNSSQRYGTAREPVVSHYQIPLPPKNLVAEHYSYQVALEAWCLARWYSRKHLSERGRGGKNRAPRMNGLSSRR